jgi:hypothetical protein
VYCGGSASIIDRLVADSAEYLVAYFYFDFKDERKKSLSGLLSSLVFQLAAHSRPCFDILIRARARARMASDKSPAKSHNDAHLHATDDTLLECLDSMLRASSKTFIVLDALDECPETTRETDVFPILLKLVGFDNAVLRLLVTSRPEREILQCMDKLSSHPLDLDKAHEHNGELARFISHEFSSPDHYKSWPRDIRLQAEAVLVKKARGM